MSYPTAKVFIGFDDGPYVDSPSWTEVTSYVRELSITRGRTQDYADFESGTAQVVLDNRDQRFSPFNTSSPYNGKLLPRRQIKIIGRANSVDYEVFRGYVSGWPVGLDEAGFDSTVTIQAFDILGLMTNEQIPSDWNNDITLGLAPLHYYKMDDATGAATLRDYVGKADLGPNPTFVSTPVSQVEPATTGIPHSSMLITQTGGWRSTNLGGPGSTQNMSIAFWAKEDVLGMGAQWYYGNSFISIGSSGGVAPAITVEYATTTTGTVGTWSAGADETQFRHYVVTSTTGSSIKLYVDGIERSFTTGSSATRAVASYDNVWAVRGVLSEASFYNKVLTQGEVTQLYNVGVGRIADTTFTRYDRLLGKTSIPVGRQEKSGTALANLLDIGNNIKAVDELKFAADSEGGFVYATRDGKLRITGREYVFDYTVDYTISDTGAPGSLKYSPQIAWQWDAENVRNDVTIQYTNSGVYQTTNPTVIAAYGAAAVNFETRLAALTDAQSLAAFELGTGSALVASVSEIDLTPNTADTEWQSILQMEILDRVRITTTPKTGSAITYDMLINQITHRAVPGQWSTTIVPSGRYTSPLILDNAVFGKLDFNYLG